MSEKEEPMRNFKGRRLSIGVLIGVVVILTSGCPSQSVVLPSAASHTDDEIAILKIDRTAKTEVSPELNGVVDLDARKIILKSESFKNYYKIKVAPGHYEVMLKVYSYGHMPAFPKVRLSAKAGMTYLFTSSVVMDGKAVKAEYKEISTPSDITPDR